MTSFRKGNYNKGGGNVGVGRTHMRILFDKRWLFQVDSIINRKVV